MAEHICAHCGSNFSGPNNAKYCGRTCVKEASIKRAWPDHIVSQIKAMAAENKTCAVISKSIGKCCRQTRKFMADNNIRNGFNLENQRKRAVACSIAGAAHPFWKGEKASYKSKHKRLYRIFGKPVECAVCFVSDGQIISYANLSGDYDDPNDFMPMCQSCHSLYDGKNNYTIEQIRHRKGVSPSGRAEQVGDDA